MHFTSWCQITCFLVTFIVSRKCAFLVCQLFTCESCPLLALTYFTSPVTDAIFVCSSLNEEMCATLAGLVCTADGISIIHTVHRNCARISLYVGYSESKCRLRMSLAHPPDCLFAHGQWLPLSIEKPKTPFREIRVMFMFVLCVKHV